MRTYTNSHERGLMTHIRRSAILTMPFLAFFPFTAFAQGPQDFKDVIELFVRFLRNVFAICIALIALGIAYGVFMYFATSGNERKRTEIKGYLFWGVVGLAAVVTLWGILALLTNTFGFGTPGIPLITPPA